MSQSPNRAASIEVLRQVHTFPGPYVFKIIGENTPEFVARILQAVVVVMGPTNTPSVSIRESAGGKHQAVTMTVRVNDAEGVLDLYEVLGGLAGVRYLL
jgi:uncharacterized protein